MKTESVVESLVRERSYMIDLIKQCLEDTLDNKPQCTDVQKPPVDPPIHHNIDYTPPTIQHHVIIPTQKPDMPPPPPCCEPDPTSNNNDIEDDDISGIETDGQIPNSDVDHNENLINNNDTLLFI